jgi:hypothetical protein
LLPIFAPGEGSYPASLASIAPEHYHAHGRTAANLSQTRLAALEQMKRHTDFNDLATRSVLGRDAFDRQARTCVSVVIRKHQACAEHQQRLVYAAERLRMQHAACAIAGGHNGCVGMPIMCGAQHPGPFDKVQAGFARRPRIIRGPSFQQP